MGQSTNFAINSAPSRPPMYLRLPIQPTYTAQLMTQQEAAYRIGYEFIVRYYTTMHTSPELLYKFYAESASMVHGTTCLNGVRNIQEFLQTLSFKNLMVRIRQLDTQPTLESGILVTIKGEISNTTAKSRGFQQTFILGAHSPCWYYIFNEIFYYFDDIFANGNTNIHYYDDSSSSLSSPIVIKEIQCVKSDASSITPQVPVTNQAEEATTSPLPEREAQPGTRHIIATKSNGIVNLVQLQQPVSVLLSSPVVFVENYSSQCCRSAQTDKVHISPKSSETAINSSPSEDTVPEEPPISESETGTEPESIASEASSSADTVDSKISIQDFPFLKAKGGRVQHSNTPDKNNQPPKVLWSDEMKQEEEKAAIKHSDSQPQSKAPVTYAEVILSNSRHRSTANGDNDSNLDLKVSNTFIPSIAFTSSGQVSEFKSKTFTPIKPKDEPLSVVQPQQREFPQQQQQQQAPQQRYFEYRGGERRDADNYNRPRGVNDPNTELFIGNIPHCATRDDIHDLFSTYGKVASFRLLTKSSNQVGQGKKPPNFGFLKFKDPIALDTCLQNRPIYFTGSDGVCFLLNVRAKNTDPYNRRPQSSYPQTRESEASQVASSNDNRQIAVPKPPNSRIRDGQSFSHDSVPKTFPNAEAPREHRRFNSNRQQSNQGNNLETPSSGMNSNNNNKNANNGFTHSFPKPGGGDNRGAGNANNQNAQPSNKEVTKGNAPKSAPGKGNTNNNNSANTNIAGSLQKGATKAGGSKTNTKR